MAKVDDATTTTGQDLGWFKISQDGLHSDGSWSSPTADGTYGFTVPSDLEPGNYLIRAETIGLHVASTYPGAQFYIGSAPNLSTY